MALVKTNDPSASSFYLTLNAFINTDRKTKPVKPATADSTAELTPHIKQFGPFEVSPADRWKVEALFGIPSNTIISITNKETAPAKVLRVEPGGHYFNVILQAVQEERIYRLIIESNPGLPLGKFSQTAQVYLGKGPVKMFPVQLEVNVNPLVYVVPAKILLPDISVKQGEAVPALPETIVQRVRVPDFEITKVISSLPFLKAEAVPLDRGHSFKIKLSLDKSVLPSPGIFKGTIQLQTNDLASKIVDIPVEGSIKSR